MNRRKALTVTAAAGLLGACAATPEQQIRSLSAGESAVTVRSRQSRRFDTHDRELLVQSALGALQDLGFTITESDARLGLLRGTKTVGSEIRAQIALRSSSDEAGQIMRATFQRVHNQPGARLGIGETLDDPALYQGFFERVAQSAFLTAHDV